MPYRLTLDLPESTVDGLEELQKLDPDIVAKLESALQHAEPVLKPWEMAGRIADQIPGQEEAIFDIIMALAGIYAAKDSTGMPLDQVADDVVDALAESDREVFELDEAGWQSFRERLHRLLDIEHSIGITSKALAVMTEHQRTFTSSRILTDVRPIFGGDLGESPTACVVVHTLKIAFQESGKPQEFFVAMDSNDILELRSTIDRTVRKASALRPLLNQAPLVELDP